jgi:hypothetical protein
MDRLQAFRLATTLRMPDKAFSVERKKQKTYTIVWNY